ncbi:5-enolpyruvylshikimate-3-phosphate synthase [Caldisphaera lagunensis DSM 15908]|uniref:3-phosphoshikimate 1-carboxyvinyltransferase n=1 Tax=Caldisphaera lagunensis (strain DSM 15908 / JCM 11604 / ANMR 0165 / IC-154) TaxID=1056495 RepID=L0A7U5_CALLD|nr:5-enolpyruvylshikimate-3-phosphate synthase [Caldisphaera lagunensis]AFZ69901.1 5-enolpyruvylshikimate-3-phosphate synthase [Caldisphaera lagunensis DSM 15908]
MKVIILPSKISGEIDAPKSKSIAIRILFGSLLNNITLREEVPGSNDVKAAYNSIIEMGVYHEGNKLKKPYSINLNKKFFAGGSATVARILSSLILTLGGNAIIDGDETLRKRPFDGLIKLAKITNSEVNGNSLPIKLSSKGIKDYIEIPELESSQYITGLMYGFAYKGYGVIKLKSRVPSFSYIMLTMDLLNDIGCKIKYEDNEIVVEKCLKKDYETSFPGDYLLSSFYAVSSLLTGGLTIIHNLYKASNYFGDHKIVDILSDIGVKSKLDNGNWIIKSENLENLRVNVDDSPDMAMSLAPLGVKVEVTLDGINRLKIKESDRIKSIKDVMEKFGSIVSIKDNTINIKPNKINKAEIDCNNDHRVAMMAASISFLSGGIINNAECIGKSDPKHWDRYEKLGGKIKVE